MPTVDGPSPVISGGCRDGSTRLLTYLTDLFDLGVSGCYNPDSTTDSGAPSYHVSGCAIDLTADWYDLAVRARGDAAFDWAVAHAEELNLQEAIFGERIITSRRWSEGVRFYAPDDHKNHVHIALGRGPADNWTPTPYVEEPDLTPEQEQTLKAAHIAAQKASDDVAKVREFLENFRAGYTNQDQGEKPVSFRTIGARIRDLVEKVLG